jgi:hypothetical protein
MKIKTGVFVHLGAVGLGFMAAACSLSGLSGLLGNDNGSTTDPSLKLVAQASAGTLVTEVSYAELGDESKFEINVTGGVPGSQIDVVVNGVVVASIPLDSAGSAHVEYSSVPDDSGDLPLPDTFVAPQAGDSVAVGDLQSTFEEDSSDDDGDSDDNSNSNSNDNDDDDSTNNTNGNTNDNGDDDSVDNDNGDSVGNLNDNSNANDNSDDVGNDNADDVANDNSGGIDNGSDDDLGNANANDNGNDNGSANDNR